MSTPVHKRKTHAFLSYSHVDAPFARMLRDWLRDVAGLEIWFDESHLPPGASVASRLPVEIGDCRAVILLLSSSSLKSPWVKSEFDRAVHEQLTTPDFQLIVLRLGSCEPSRDWDAVNVRKWLEVPMAQLDPSLAHQLLMTLHHRTKSAATDDEPDVFVTRSWRDHESPLGDEVCARLAAQGVRLIGDSLDQKHFDPEVRIRRIMAGCGAHLAVLPARGKQGENEKDYKYFLKEVELARALGLPQLILCESKEVLPTALAGEAHECPKGLLESDTNSPEMAGFASLLDDLRERRIPPPGPEHAFLAAEYDGQKERNRLAKELIERVTSMPCRMGSDFAGDGLRQQIVESVRSSQIMLADLLGSIREGSPAEINVNTCIEAGIALGADVKRELLARTSGESGKTQRLPFMFRDYQIHWYRDEVEFLGHCHRLVIPHRRRVLNEELHPRR